MDDEIINAAVEAARRGYQPLPLRSGKKTPSMPAWQHIDWDGDLDAVRAAFRSRKHPNVGIVLGRASDGLVDVDIDHPRVRTPMRDLLLPRTHMRSGRPGRPGSHYWYQLPVSELPATRQYKMPDGKSIVELRSTGGQTAIPPSIHPTGEQYRWESDPWGGVHGPLQISSRRLTSAVAVLALCTVLVDAWPEEGGRHDAYLALAGGLLRYGGGVHPWWVTQLPSLIKGIAAGTFDEDGAQTRISEVMGSTEKKLKDGERHVRGWPSLARLLGDDHVRKARELVAEVERLHGFVRDETVALLDSSIDALSDENPGEVAREPSEGKSDGDEQADPVSARSGDWDLVNLEPYIDGSVVMPEPTVLCRSDGRGLMYPGRINSLYGASESAKSWIALYAGLQEMNPDEGEEGGEADPGRVLYIDFEDGPALLWDRLRRLGAGADTIRNQFFYVLATGALGSMQRDRWGGVAASDRGRENERRFEDMLAAVDPTMIILDGMSVLYGLHGLDPNRVDATEVITSWLRKQTRGELRTVIIIDHTGKGAARGATPTGSQHKIAAIQGTALQVYVETQPRDRKVGELTLYVGKDRPGAVRSWAQDGKPQVGATVLLDSTEDQVTRVSIEPPDEGEVRVDLESVPPTKLTPPDERPPTIKERLRELIPTLFGGDLDVELASSVIGHRLTNEHGIAHGDATRRAVLSELVRNGELIKGGTSKKTTTYRLHAP